MRTPGRQPGKAWLDVGSLLSLRFRVLGEVGSRSLTIQAGLTMQESATLLRWAAGFQVSAARCLPIDWCSRGHVRDLFRVGVLATDLSDAGIRSLASLGEGVVTAVEVLAFLETCKYCVQRQL